MGLEDWRRCGLRRNRISPDFNDEDRQRHIASRIGVLGRKYRSLLAVVEYERAASVRSMSAVNAP